MNAHEYYFSADIAPIGGHDGFDTAGGDFRLVEGSPALERLGVQSVDVSLCGPRW